METALGLAREAIYKKEEPNPNPREEIRIVEHKIVRPSSEPVRSDGLFALRPKN